MQLRPLFLVAAGLFAAALPAQTRAPEPKRTRALTEEQVEERLQRFKEGWLPKVMSDRATDDKQKQEQWLRKWQAVQSDHYLVFTNGPTATVKKFGVTLEELYSFIQTEMPFEDLDHLLVAYIFKDSEEYIRFCVEVAGWSEESARGTAGHATAAYYATYYQSPRAHVVFHEATHQIVGACLKVGGVGSWFQEGMAEYFAKRILNGDPEGLMRSALKRGDYYPLQEFFAISTLLSDPKGHGRRNYEHAGALVDFLVNTKLEPVAGKFPDFLVAARKGRGFGRGLEVSERLAREVYGLSLPELEELWKKHHGLR